MFNFFRKNTPDNSLSEGVNDQQPIEDFNDIEPIAHYFKTKTGITFESQKTILKSKLISFCKTRQLSSFKQCLQQVQSDPVLKQELVNYLTTNESYFYRELDQIMDLVKNVKQTHHVVDILCAPSSTGEEAYSIVMALFEAHVPETQFNIVGIDINTEALKHAQSGIYNERNVSKLPIKVLTKYFKKNDSKYSLSEQVKRCVSLKSENIFSPSFKTIGKFDYIFSRNMLIYFDRETKIRAREILESLLKDRNKPIYFGHADLF